MLYRSFAAIFWKPPFFIHFVGQVSIVVVYTERLEVALITFSVIICRMKNNKASAAVALIIAECESTSVLLLRRAKNRKDPWSGQWAFPGGKWEEGDTDLVDTSIRETYEECGCLLSRDELSKSLPLAMAGNYSGYPVMVAPFLWKIKEQQELQIDGTEVEDARWQEVDHLKDMSLHKDDLVIPDYPEHNFSYVMLDDVPLWGFTYSVLMNYLQTHH